MTRFADLNAMGWGLMAPAGAWLGLVVLASLAGYPGIIFATPAAWLLALLVGRTTVIRSRSERLRLRLLEALLAGSILGLLQGVAFLVINPLFIDASSVEGETARTWGVVILVVGTVLGGLLASVMGARIDRLRRARKAGDAKLEVTSQFCPICSKTVMVSARYPRSVCEECAAQAADAQGRLVVFYNQGLSGGLLGRYRDSEEPFNERECYIRGVKCRVEEAHLGGVVIYPLN